MPKKNSGFTVIELLVVISAVFIFGLIVWFAFSPVSASVFGSLTDRELWIFLTGLIIGYILGS